MKIGPDLYPIPLEVRITKVEPATLGPHDKFLLEIELRNTGSAPFFFPICRDIGGMEDDENRGRRTGGLFIYFEDVPPSERKGVGVLAGSPSVPLSLKRLNPGDSVLVRTSTDLRSYNANQPWLIPDDKQYGILRVGYSEWTLRDDQFVIQNRSQEVPQPTPLGLL